METQNANSGIFYFVSHFFKILYWYLEAIYRFVVPPSMKYIDGEVILVTGATGGIGSEICRYIVKCGYDIKLILWDLNINELNKLAEELNSTGSHGLTVFCYEVDISDRENIDKCCTQVKKDVGPVTIIFNNAGIPAFGSFLSHTNEQIEKTFQVNFMSQLWIVRQFLPAMLDKNHGRIVNICSCGALIVGPNILPYVTSKIAVNGYTEALKSELAVIKNNAVRCTTVYPYFTKTPIIKSFTVVETAAKRLPVGYHKFLEPAFVAKKAVDGMRREYEYVYLPQTIPLLVLSYNLMPTKLRNFMKNSQLRCFTFKDSEELEKFTAPLVSPDEK